MPTTVIVICVITVLVSAAGYTVIRCREHKKAVARERAWLPRDLRLAELVLSEPRPIIARGPVPLIAKPDRAYRRPNGMVTIAELKSRRHHAVYDDDVIELSVQRTVLEANGYGPVDREGIVVTQLHESEERRVHRVRLMTTEETYALARRYVDIMAGRAAPTRVQHRSKCEQCGHFDRCKPIL